MSKEEKARDKYLLRKYGITLAAYNNQLLLQNNACWICQRDVSNFATSLAVDHNHKTGQTRGLLCFYCNKRRVGRNDLASATKLYEYMKYFETEERWPERVEVKKKRKKSRKKKKLVDKKRKK